MALTATGAARPTPRCRREAGERLRRERPPSYHYLSATLSPPPWPDAPCCEYCNPTSGVDSVQNAFIVGTGAFYPNAAVDNDSIETVLGCVEGEPSWAKDAVLQSCGILSRHYAIDPRTRLPTHTNAELTAAAIRQAVAAVGCSVKDIDLLACGTSSPDQLNPSHACMVHGELASHPLEAVSFSGFCASSTLALRYAALSVRSGERSLAAVCGSEIASAALRAERFRLPKPTASRGEIVANPFLTMNKEFLRWILSDGAACALVAPGPRADGPSFRIEWIDGTSMAHSNPVCMYAGGVKDRKTGRLTGWLQMPDLAQAVSENVMCLTQDVDLLRRSIIQVGIKGVFGDIVRLRGLRPDDYAFFLPHLSSFFFREPVAEAMAEVGCGIPVERWFTNLDRVGNLGSASLLSMLDAFARSPKCRPGQKILCGVPESGRFSFYFVELTVV